MVAGIAALAAIVVVGATVIVRKRDHEKSGRNERILASLNPKKVIQNTKKPGETKNNRGEMFPEIQRRSHGELETGIMGSRDLHCGLDGGIFYCIHDRTGQ